MLNPHLLASTSTFAIHQFETMLNHLGSKVFVPHSQSKIFSSSLYGGMQRMVNSHPKVYVNGERYFDFDCWGGTVTINKPRFKGECYMVVDYAIEREQYILNRHHDHLLQ